jgi:hypothetical protein
MLSIFSPLFFQIRKVDRLYEQVYNTDGYQPSPCQIVKEKRYPENPTRREKDMDEGEIHHDDPKHEENDPCLLEMKTAKNPGKNPIPH